MNRKKVPIKEVFGNTMTMLGFPVTERYHPSFVLKPQKKFPFIKPIRWSDYKK